MWGGEPPCVGHCQPPTAHDSAPRRCVAGEPRAHSRKRLGRCKARPLACLDEAGTPEQTLARWSAPQVPGPLGLVASGGWGGPDAEKGGNGAASDSPWGDNAGQGSGNPLAPTGETLTLPTSCPSPRVQRPAGPGVLLPPRLTAGRSLDRTETVGWGGQRAESWGPRPGVCRGPGSAGPRPQGREARGRVGPRPGAGPPTESPSSAGSDARYGSQAAQACLGPVARLGGGGPHFLPPGPEEEARGTEIPGHPQTWEGEGNMATGSLRSRPALQGIPPWSPWAPQLTCTQSSPWLGNPRTGGRGGAGRVSEPPL